MAGERLARAIKNQATNEKELSDLVFGVVISTSPLQIKVESRFTVSSEFLILSQMVKHKSVSFENKSITIFEDLKAGETVRMLRVSKGQKFFVLDRG